METDPLQGADIAKVLSSEGPIVKCVILRAAVAGATNDTINGEEQEDKKPPAKKENGDSNSNNNNDDDDEPCRRPILTNLINEIEIDTTPSKSMVAKILGGSFTFLGQYEDEGIVLMMRNQQGDADNLPVNPHKLQPPFQDATVRGDILVLKVAPEEPADGDDEENNNNCIVNKSNEEFFLNYTMDEFMKFAARTDVVAPVVSMEDIEEDENEEDASDEEDEAEEEMEGEDDSEDEEEGAGGFMELLMGQVMQRFQQENGRMPDELELQALQGAIAQKLGGAVDEADDE